MIRSYVFALWMWGSAAVLGLLGLPALLHRPAAMAVSKLWARGVLGGLKLICGLGYTVRGRENLPEGAAVVAVKHQSMWETVALTVVLPEPCFVLKKELGTIPVFGWYCRANGFIFVDRLAGAKALRAMTAGAKAAADRGAQVVIFPEGTRVPLGRSLPYQPGVAALAKTIGAPIVPVAHNSAVYWRHPGLERRQGSIEIEIMAPLTPGLSRPALMAALEDAIEPATKRLEAADPALKDEAPA